MGAGLKRWRLVLIASLALNLFALGAATTAWVGERGWLPFLRVPERHGRLIGPPGARQLRVVLAERHQPVLDRALGAHRPEIRRRIRELIAARVAVADAIRAEPYDRARVEAALAGLRERETAVALAAHGMMLDLVDGLDAEGRARVAETLLPRRARPGRGR